MLSLVEMILLAVLKEHEASRNPDADICTCFGAASPRAKFVYSWDNVWYRGLREQYCKQAGGVLRAMGCTAMQERIRNVPCKLMPSALALLSDCNTLLQLQEAASASC